MLFAGLELCESSIKKTSFVDESDAVRLFKNTYFDASVSHSDLICLYFSNFCKITVTWSLFYHSAFFTYVLAFFSLVLS